MFLTVTYQRFRSLKIFKRKKNVAFPMSFSCVCRFCGNIKARKVCLEMKYVFISIFYSFSSSFFYFQFSLVPVCVFRSSFLFPIHKFYFTHNNIVQELFFLLLLLEAGGLMKVIRKPNRFYYLFNLLIAHGTYTVVVSLRTHKVLLLLLCDFHN